MNFWLVTMILNIQSRWLPQNCGNVILSCPRIYGITSQCCCMAERFCCCARAWKTRLTILGRSKPKHHSFLDLLLQNSCPSDSWTYRDEDFRGFLAHLGAVKGGSHNPYCIGMRHECSAKFSSTSDSRAEVKSFAARIWDKEVSSLLQQEVQDLLAIENLRRNFKEEFFKKSTLI